MVTHETQVLHQLQSSQYSTKSTEPISIKLTYLMSSGYITLHLKIEGIDPVIFKI